VLARAARALEMRSVWISGFHDRRDDLPSKPSFASDLVSGDLVGHQSEAGDQRAGPSASVGAGELRNGMQLSVLREGGCLSSPCPFRDSWFLVATMDSGKCSKVDTPQGAISGNSGQKGQS